MVKGKALITGKDGLLGNALKRTKRARSRGVFIGRQETDLTDYNSVKTLFSYIRPTTVIHTAAEVAGIGGNLIHSGEYFRNNVLMNVNVLEAARQTGVKKLISFTSTCIFPDRANYPLSIDQIHNGPPHPSNFGYAYAKRMLEVQSRAYRNEWGCNYVVLIPSNMYGPNDFWDVEDGHVIPSLIHKCYLAKKNNTSLTIWGSGKPLREFLYVDDIAKLTWWALDHYDSEKPLILSSGIEISIKDLVGLVVDLMKFKGKVVFDKEKPDGQFRKPSDTKPLKKLYPKFKWTKIEKGLELTIDWFEANYNRIRL